MLDEYEIKGKLETRVEDDEYVGIVECYDIDLVFLFREVKPVIPPIAGDSVTLCFKPSFSSKFGKVWVLAHMYDADGTEYLHLGQEDIKLIERRILIHKGNRKENSAGCFLVGTKLDTNGKLTVLNSTQAFDKLMAVAGDREVVFKLQGNWKW